MMEPGATKKESGKELIGKKSIAALTPATTVGAVIAVVLLFSPWYAFEEPFFGLWITENAFDATSPLLGTILAYPLIGLYVIAVGGLWAHLAGFMPLGVALTLTYLSLGGAFILVLEVLELVFSVMGTAQYGLWCSAAFTLAFAIWALTLDTFFKPKKVAARDD